MTAWCTARERSPGTSKNSGRSRAQPASISGCCQPSRAEDDAARAGFVHPPTQFCGANRHPPRRRLDSSRGRVPRRSAGARHILPRRDRCPLLKPGAGPTKVLLPFRAGFPYADETSELSFSATSADDRRSTQGSRQSMAGGTAEGRRVFVSTLPAGPGERRLALAVVFVSLAIFLSAAPFAKLPLGQVWAFIPIYQSALVVNDLITAVLLFGQFGFLRSRALLVLASGYLFTAFMAVSHMLTFPGLFAPTGLLGAGPQSTAWLYLLWHGGFPLLIVAYALLKDRRHET